MGAEPNTPDYAAMSGPKLLDSLGDDGSLWAAAFCQIAKKNHGLDIDEGWMLAWFANAIEHSTAVRQARARPRTEPIISKDMNDFRNT